MKKIFSIFGALLAGALMFSCSDQYEEEITFGTEITTSTQSLGEFAQENAEAKTLEVTANGEWIAVAPAWVEVSPAFGGEGTTTVSVRTKDNYELVEKDGELVSELGPKRSAKIQFAGEQNYDKIPVDADGDGEQDLDKDGKPVWEYLDAIAEVSLSQAGDPNKWDPAVPRPVTMQYFNEVATVGDGFTYILTGKITEVANTSYGNFYFEDETGVAYVYGLLTPDGKAQTQWAAAGLKVNDVITVQGARAEYKGDPQMSNATYISHTVGEASPIVDATVAEFLAAEKSGTQYRISGVVSSIVKAEYGNINLKDATGEVYVYGIGAKGEFEGMGIEVGDIVTLISNRGEYNGTPQAANSTLEKKIDVTAMTVAEFLATEESKNNYYMLTGTVDALKDGDQYGNFNITDESGSVYVYGLLAGWKGASKQFQSTLEATGLKAGDTLTLIGYHTSYNDADQVGGAFYFSHEAGQGGGEEPEPEPTPVVTISEITEEGTFKVEGATVLASYARGYLLGDATGKMLAYLGSDHGFDFVEGDVLTVEGSTSIYGGFAQFTAGSTLTKTGTTTVDHGTAEVMDAAALDAYVAAPAIKYISYTGTLAVNGNYFNVNVEGTQTAIGSIQYPINSEAIKAFDGKNITVTGYAIGVSSGKYVNTMVMNVVEATTTEPGGDTTGNVLAWTPADFKAVYEAVGAETLDAAALATMTATDDLTINADGVTYKGLEFLLGGGKFKFAAKNYSITVTEGDKPYRVQFGGTGSLTKQVLIFEAPAAGTLKVEAVSSSSSEARTLVVATESAELGQFVTVLQGSEATGEVFTVDCSNVAAGEKIYLYSQKSGINIFNIEYAY